MNTTRAGGVALTALGVAGYVVGVLASYPGRAFSIVSVMIGITLFAIGGDGRAES